MQCTNIQFDWGISKMVGPKKAKNQHTWLILKKRVQNVGCKKQGAITVCPTEKIVIVGENKVYFLQLWPFLTNWHSSNEFFSSFFLLLSTYVDFWPTFLLFKTHHLWNFTIELILMYINSNLQKLTLLFDKGEIASLTQKNFFFPLCNKQVTLFKRKIKEKSTIM